MKILAGIMNLGVLTHSDFLLPRKNLKNIVFREYRRHLCSDHLETTSNRFKIEFNVGLKKNLKNLKGKSRIKSGEGVRRDLK